MQKRCGQCPSCQNPHHKKACTVTKASREVDCASRHVVPSRRHRPSLDPVPLAKLAQQPATKSPALRQHHPHPKHVTARNSRSPSIDPETEGPSHHTCFEGERGKRAATEDSDNEPCHKKSCLAADNSNEPGQGAASGMASRDTPDPFSWQTRQGHTACVQPQRSTSDQPTDAGNQEAVTNSEQKLSQLLAQADHVIDKLRLGSSQAYSDAQKLAQMVQKVNVEHQVFQAEAASSQAAAEESQAADTSLHAANQQAEDLLTQLQQQTAVARGQRQQLQQQKADTEEATAGARLISQQLQEDTQALQEAATSANAARSTLAAQMEELKVIKQDLLSVTQQAQQVSRNLEVDVGSAQQSFDSQTKSFQIAKEQAAAACSNLQALMAAAKQQQQQHMEDTASQLLQASEAAQHAQAAEAEAKLAVEELVAAIGTHQAAATAAAHPAEQALQNFNERQAAAEQAQAELMQQQLDKLKKFLLLEVGKAVPMAVSSANSDWRELHQSAKEARDILEGVSNDISSNICKSMQDATQCMQRRLVQLVEAVVANVHQTGASLPRQGEMGLNHAN